MEVYYGTINRIRHRIWVNGEFVAADGPVNLTITRADGEDVLVTQAQQEGDYYYVDIGPGTLSGYETYSARWEYAVNGEPVSFISDRITVVNPYCTYEQFITMYPNANLLPGEFGLVEPLVRKVVEAYCNQTFTREDDRAYTVSGTNSDGLPLPKQLITLKSLSVLDDHVNSDETVTPYDITPYVIMDEDNRWFLRRRTSHTVNRALSPTHQRSLFSYPRRYRVFGDWGWEFVPENITRATAILINDYDCADAKWREKYVNTIRAGDWRMEFGATGDETTGNANADMILSGYRNLSLAVI